MRQHPGWAALLLGSAVLLLAAFLAELPHLQTMKTAIASALAVGTGSSGSDDVCGRIARRRTDSASAVLQGQSRSVLLAGVALNWLGAAKIARDVWARPPRPDVPADHDQLKAFASGTAATFGSFYLYLYVKRKPVVPLLMFGAALKMWAFVLSLILRAQGRLDRGNFLSFGVSNGLVGGLFWIHIAAEARARRHR